MGLDAAGHYVPASTDAPARSAFDKLSRSLRDPLPVADTAARTALLATLAAASPAVVPSTSSPIFFYQEALPAGYRTVYTVDGSNFISLSGVFVWADSAARTAATTMAAGDKGFQVDTKVSYRYTGTAWKGVADGQYVELSSAKPVATGIAATVGLTTPTDWGYTEVSDAQGWHDAATNPARITPNIAGRYRVQLIGAWAASATGLRYYWIGINGAYSNKNRKVISTTDLGADPQGASIVLAEFAMNGTTNYITVQSYQTSGGALAMDLALVITYLGES